jgi:hypothetical protein
MGGFPLFSRHTRTVILPPFASEPPSTLVYLAAVVAVAQLGLGLALPSKLLPPGSHCSSDGPVASFRRHPFVDGGPRQERPPMCEDRYERVDHT